MTRWKAMQINDSMREEWQTAPCLDGRAHTRVEICAPPLYPPCEVFAGDPRYPPPGALQQRYGSTNAYRQQQELIGCRWCGGTRPTEKCLARACGRAVPERREKQRLFQLSKKPYADLSFDRNPKCSACLPRGPPVRYTTRGHERYEGPCQPLKTSQEPVNTSIYKQSMTKHDFKSPGTHCPWSVTKGDRRSFYDRFMADMCRTCVLAPPIPRHGSLGGEITLYQADFDERPPRQLCRLYKLPDECESPISAAASAFATCHTLCNFSSGGVRSPCPSSPWPLPVKEAAALARANCICCGVGRQNRECLVKLA